jgi:hypothetical protein
LRYAARTDASQREIAGAFRAHGAVVALTHTVGAGFPDLVVGFVGRTHLVEAKIPFDDENWRPSHDFTDEQKKFRQTWSGCLHVARSAEDAAELVKAWRDGREEPTKRKGWTP